MFYLLNTPHSSYFFCPFFLKGRMHQNLGQLSKCKIVTNKDQFRRHVDDPKFLDVHVLTPTTAILTSQSLIVTRHTNIPSISSKIYQKSKFMMLRGFFFIAARLCAFSGDGGVRLAGSDTGRETTIYKTTMMTYVSLATECNDSIFPFTTTLNTDYLFFSIHSILLSDSYFIAWERQRSSLETREIQILTQNKRLIDYTQTLHARLFSEQYLKSVGSILDFSSITNDSIVFNTLFKDHDDDNDEERQTKVSMRASLNFLRDKTRSQPFHLKDETNNSVTKSWVSPCSKIYILTTAENTNTFPIMKPGPGIQTNLKSKGIPRAFKSRSLNYHEFVNVVIKKKPSKRIQVASLKKHFFNISLVTSTRSLLSVYNTKRQYVSKTARSSSQFSFPLHFRQDGIVDI